MSSAWRGHHCERHSRSADGGALTVADTTSPDITSPPAGAGASAPKEPIGQSRSLEMSSNQTSLGFARTLMSADRTLMSTLRTALSLISFGFTIDQAFHQLHKSGAKIGEVPARNFGLALILLGMAMLVMGIFGHAKFRRSLTARRQRLFAMGLLHTDLPYTATPTFIASVLVLLLGLAAAAGILIRMRLLP
jgi:putative membrane protein